jgi:hypothetical protein
MATEIDQAPVSDPKTPSVAIWRTLTLMQQIFSEYRRAAHDSMQHYDVTGKDLQSEASKMQAEIETLENRTAFLTEAAYERLEPIDGEASQRFERVGLFRRAPNYTFALVTKWPIRTVIAEPPESSRAWLSFPSYSTTSSSCEFIATLKVSKLATPWAAVELFGWRREIHDAEISINKATIQVLQHEQAQKLKNFATATMRYREQRELRDTYDAGLATVEHDLIQLSKSTAPIQQGATPTQNIYMHCRAYGLGAKIKRSEVPSGLKAKCEPRKCLPYFETLNDLQELAAGLLIALQERYSDLLTMRNSDTSFFESESESSFNKAKPSSLNYLRSLAKKDNAGENSIIQQALKSLENLDESTTGYMSRQIDSFKELHDARKTPPDMSDFDCGIDDLVNDRAEDLEATEIVKGFITDADMGVSVMTYLLAKESAAEGWADVLDGVREDLAERTAASQDREPEIATQDQDKNVRQSG